MGDGVPGDSDDLDFSLSLRLCGRSNPGKCGSGLSSETWLSEAVDGLCPYGPSFEAVLAGIAKAWLAAAATALEVLVDAADVGLLPF